MKETFGRPQALVDNLFQALGNDWQWWLVPTTPELDINLFEKLYTIKQLKRMREFEEDDYDPQKKGLAEFKRKGNLEKKLLLGLIVSNLLVWYGYLRFEVQTLI